MTLTQATRQTNRLSQCAKWSDLLDEGKAELARQIALLFTDETHAARAIDLWVRFNKWVPTVADLADLANETRHEPVVPSDHNCEHCNGSGFRPAWELVTCSGGMDRRDMPIRTVERIKYETYRELLRKVDGLEQVVSEAVESCVCAWGQHLRIKRVAKQLRKEQELIEKRGGRAA